MKTLILITSLISIPTFALEFVPQETPVLEFRLELEDKEVDKLKEEIKKLQKNSALADIIVEGDLTGDGQVDSLRLFSDYSNGSLELSIIVPKQTQGATFGERVKRSSESGESLRIDELTQIEDIGISSNLGEIALEEEDLSYRIHSGPRQTTSTDRRAGKNKYKNLVLKKSDPNPDTAAKVFAQYNPKEIGLDKPRAFTITAVNTQGATISQITVESSRIRPGYTSRRRVEVLKSN